MSSAGRSARATAAPRVGAGSASREVPFGERLRARRRALGLTQAQLAAGAAVDHSYISLLEAGKRMPTSGALRRLTERLHCAPDDLVGSDSREGGGDGTANLPNPRSRSRPLRDSSSGREPLADVAGMVRRARHLSAAGNDVSAAAALTTAAQRLQRHRRLIERAAREHGGPRGCAVSRRQLAVAWREAADTAHAAGLTAEAIAGWREALDLTLGPPLPWDQGRATGRDLPGRRAIGAAVDETSPA